MRIRPATMLRAATISAAALGLSSATYQKLGDIRDRRRHPPPGELVDIGGRRLHMVRIGAGSLAVVIEPCLAGTAAEWAYVQRDLADTTTVITYDRAGLGWSDPAPRWRRRTAAFLADDLHRLLVAADVPPPYLLVGHSMGGYLIRVFQTRYPELVGGLVLADSSPDQPIEPLRWVSRERRRTLRLWLRPWGLHRLCLDLGFIEDVSRSRAKRLFPPDLVDGEVAMGRSSRHLRADAREMWRFWQMAAEVRTNTPSVPGSLDGLPLLVLTSSEIAPGLTGVWAEWRRRNYSTWTILQKNLAALSTNSVHLVAESAGHHLHHDDRSFVVSAIRDQVQRYRAATERVALNEEEPGQ